MPVTTRRRAQTSENPPGMRQLDEQTVTFWGVRGTMPSPGEQTLRYGGNTSCVEVALHSPRGVQSLVFDAGSGIATYAASALKQGVREFHILLSHMHYDHIMGLTRFAPLFRSDCEITIYGLRKQGKSLQEMFEQFFSFPFFPVEYRNLPSLKNLSFREVNGLAEMVISGMDVEFQQLSHPQGAVAFRAHNAARTTSIVYATDHEHGSAVDHDLMRFSQNATMILYDSTYCQEEYEAKYKGWGHSSALMGARLAKNSNVGSYGLFHHDPDATDDDLETKLLPEAMRVFDRSFLCAEGQTINLSRIAAGAKQVLSSPRSLDKRPLAKHAKTS